MVEKSEQIVREAPEVEAYKLGLLESAKKLADQGVTLPKQQVAGMSGLQQEAFQQAQSGIDSFRPYLEEAGYTLGDAQAAFDPSGIGAFMNPYQQAIQDEINRAYDIQAQQAALGAVGQPGGPSAFGGSRAEIAQREIDRNRTSALAQAQAEAFLNAQRQQLATGEGLSQLGLRQAALGETGQQLGQQQAGFLFDLGKQQQAQDQAVLEAQRQSELQQAYEPYQRVGFLSDIYKGAPTTAQTITAATSPSVSPAQTILGLGIGGLSAAAGAQRAGLFG